MKTMKRSLIALATLIASGSFASLFQPGVPSKDDAPIRITIGATSDMVSRPASVGTDLQGFGLESLAGGLGISSNLGYGFEVGLAGSLGRKGFLNGKLFNKHSRDNDLIGTNLNLELLLGYKPEVCEGFNLGGYFVLGWDKMFTGNAEYKKHSDAVKFGTLYFQVGPSLSYRFDDLFDVDFSLYFNPAFQLKDINFYDDAKIPGPEAARKLYKENYSNAIGVVLPVGLKIGPVVLEYALKFNRLNIPEAIPTQNKQTVAENVRHGVTLALAFEI